MSYEFLEHTADIIIRATGKDIKEAFEQAALGTYQVITDISLINQEIEKEVTISSEDLESLLFDWIEQLIFLFDTELFISNKIAVNKIEKNEEGKFVLNANLLGEKFNTEKHTQKSEVKAMTYSFMKINDTTVEFTLDL